MKCFCFSDWDEKKLDHMSASERESFIKSCFACVDVLRTGGVLLRSKPLENPRGVKNLCRQSRRVCITDGPFPETKEQLGGILWLGADRSNRESTRRGRYSGSVRFRKVTVR